MTWIKICGITNPEDACTAVDAGADALGFVFYEKSPRKVDPETVRQIIQRIPARIEKVGVFVGMPAPEIREIADTAGLTALQLHPGSNPMSRIPVHDLLYEPAKKIFAVVTAQSLFQEQSKPEGSGFVEDQGKSIDGLLFDSGNAQTPGGTGKVFDWQKVASTVASFSDHFKIIVAGGLNPENVKEAMRILSPWGVDVCSGVELCSGKKDPGKVRAFIAAVHDADRIH